MRTLILGMAVTVFCLLSVCAMGQKIDFETYPYPPYAPVEELAVIYNQWSGYPYYVTFELVGHPQGKKYPIAARVGDPEVAFYGPEREDSCAPGDWTVCDKPAAGQDVGCVFITDDSMSGFTHPILRVNYLVPAKIATGDILDIDQTEAWRITAFYKVGSEYVAYDNPVELDSASPGAGNGLATPWELDPGGDIDRIEVEYTGDTMVSAGLAFDNFEPREEKPVASKQELLVNNYPDTFYDLTAVIKVPLGADYFPLDSVWSDKFLYYDTVWALDTLLYIRWYGGTIAPGDKVEACFETEAWASCAKIKRPPSRWSLGCKYWSRSDSTIIDKACPVNDFQWSRVTDDSIRCTIGNNWVYWLGDGWPPDPIDTLGAPVGDIVMSDVFWAVTDRFRSMEELNEDLYTDPTITWHPLPDTTLGSGDSVCYDLVSDFSRDDVALLRCVLTGEGLTSQDISQIPLTAVLPDYYAAVLLVSFHAIERDGYVEVEWATATELGNAGFNIYRSGSEGDAKVKLNDELIPAKGDELTGAVYTFRDYGAAAGGDCFYWFEDVGLDGRTRMNGPVKAERRTVPGVFRLAQNFPNPFNPVTEIRYDLAEDCHVRLDIYNVLGQKVKTLVDANLKAGYRTARWNGENSKGSPVSSGIYFYRLRAGSFVDTKKMVLLR